MRNTLPTGHPHRPLLAAAVLCCATLVLGVIGGLSPSKESAPVASAQGAACKAPNQGCTLDPNKTSIVLVQHVYDPASSNQAVEPDTGENITIDAYWNSNAVPCQEHTEQATVRVDWDSATDTWVLSNINLTANIIAIDVCQLSSYSCSTVSDGHSYGYKLRVNVTDPIYPGAVQHNLRQVVYTTTAVDDGFLLNLGSCSLGTGVTVNSQTWTATDTGAFECSCDCTQTGPTMTIEY
jgi:hypothetical protein